MRVYADQSEFQVGKTQKGVHITMTDEKDKQFAEVLESLKNVPGPVMMAMQKAQDIYGYLPLKVQLQIADYFDVPLATVYGIATFYSQFRLEQPGQIKIAVCLGTACYVKGSGGVIEKFGRILGVEPGHTTPRRSVYARSDALYRLLRTCARSHGERRGVRQSYRRQRGRDSR